MANKSKVTNVTFTGSKKLGNKVTFTPAKSTKATTRKAVAKKVVTQYETVQPNIQKIITPSGNVSYRVRVGYNGETLSEYATSLRKAQIARKAMLA